MIVFDASVVLALLNERDPHHSTAVELAERHAGDQRLLPASAYSECLVLALRTSERAAAVIEDAIADRALEVVPIDRGTARRAAQLRAAHRSLRLPDALVLATADTLTADAVLTADKTWTRYSKRVRVI